MISKLGILSFVAYDDAYIRNHQAWTTHISSISIVISWDPVLFNSSYIENKYHTKKTCMSNVIVILQVKRATSGTLGTKDKIHLQILRDTLNKYIWYCLLGSNVC